MTPSPKDHERLIPISPLAGGIMDRRNSALIRPDHAARARNVEFDRDSVAAAHGQVKFGGQVAPHSAIRTRVDPALSPLYAAAGLSVPMRGYAYFPYDTRYDIGGDGPSSGSGTSSLFHATRGTDFSIRFSFEIPPEEKLYSLRNGADSGPINNPADSDVINLQTKGGYDIALEECTILFQKGGDRLSPMSWAIGIVNVGDKLNYLTGSSFVGASAYLPVFIWLDMPSWGQEPNLDLQYLLTDGAVVPANVFASGALRAIVATHAIIPGTRHHISVDLKRDTGTGGSGATPTTAWNEDGRFEITVADEDEDPTTYNEASGLFIWKGPTDSIDYLEKYGVRFSGKDAMFGGLGNRQIPHNQYGFIPYGIDSAALESGGFKMIDFSNVGPPAASTLTGEHFATGDTHLLVNHVELWTGNGTQAASPCGPKVSGNWDGLNKNPGALRNYWGVFYKDAPGNKHNGLRMKLGDYSGSPSPRIEADMGGNDVIAARDFGILAFRWHQRDLILEGLEIRNAAVSYTDDRRKWELRHHLELDDATSPDRTTLEGYWPLTDGGGATLKELIGGRDGYLMPFGLGSSKNGTRGENMLALSGEGEAVVLDFSDHPVLKREIEHMLGRKDQGFAIEITCVMPEAFYALDDQLTSSPLLVEGEFAPDIVAWSVKKQGDTGVTQKVRPLLRLTHRARWTHNRIIPSLQPMGFYAEVAQATDQEDLDPIEIVEYWDGTNFTWDQDASWVGKTMTIQLGVQPTAVADVYEIYIAATPKGDLDPLAGDSNSGEVSFFTASVAIQRKDLVRSVITIGGSWDPSGLGYSELNCRMLLDEVRIFATAAPGKLASASGNEVTDGKILGGLAYPGGELVADDLLQLLGPSLETADVTEGASQVDPPQNGRFYTDEPEDVLRAIKNAYLIVAGDDIVVREEKTEPEVFLEFYRIDDVESDGKNLTLSQVYEDASRGNALARAFRMIGYTAFGDDTSARAPTLGRGKVFDPATTTEDDVVISDELWFNLAPNEVNFRLRFYSPLGHAALRELLPQWSRGVRGPRSNRCLGITAKDGRVYAGFQGALYEADDRWTDAGPTEVLTKALWFRGHRPLRLPVLFPLEADRVETEEALAGFTTALLTNKTIFYDSWVELDQVLGIQTIQWIGDKDTDPTKNAGVHKIQVWTRINNGRPEFVVGSSDTFDGTNIPAQGLFVATGNATIQQGVEVHLRWLLRLDSGNTKLLVPKLMVNGREVGVVVNARANTFTGSDWLTMANIPQTFGTELVLLGAARASHDDLVTSETWTENEITALETKPDKLVGFLFGLSGRLAEVAIVTTADTTAYDNAAGFDPTNIIYPGAGNTTEWQAGLQEGLGHKTAIRWNDGASQVAYGIIRSHPCISRFHEFGTQKTPISFAPIEDKVYAANGGRVIYADDRGTAKFAGIRPPTTKPSFTVERIPIFEENVQADSPDGEENGPVDSAGDGVDPRIMHLNSIGNTYLRQEFQAEMRWEQDGTDYDIFAFKCFFRLRSVTGRIALYSSRDSTDSGGPFVELRDGVLYVGWFDTLLKKEVDVHTSKAVAKPGFVHYVHVRKRFPQKDGWQGTAFPGSGTSNWKNSIFEFSAAETGDVAVCRFFEKSATAAVDRNGLEALINATERNSVSFTTDDVTAPSGTTAQGLVTDPNLTVDAATNVITTTAGSPFTPDMIGMLWQFGTGATDEFKLFRISAVTATTLTVLNLDGSTPTITETAVIGGVFLGVSLIKSTDFDASTQPDKSTYPIELFGSAVSIDPTTGVAPFDGQFWSFAYFIAKHTGSENVDVFETFKTDRIETGSDVFQEPIYDPGGGLDPGPGELNVTSGDVFLEVSCQPYGGTILPVSPEPSEDLEVTPGGLSSVNAPSIFVQHLVSPLASEGPSRFSVVFYDRDQAVRSNPGPVLVIDPGPEEASNLSGQVRFVLDQLPVSRQKGNIERWIFASLPGGQEQFLVAKIPDNTSESLAIEITPDKIERATEILRFVNGVPPECSVLAAGLDSLWFGGLKIDPNVIQWSRPFFPVQVPAGNFLPLLTRGTGPVTAMGSLKGRMIVYKRDSLWRIGIEGGVPIREHVSRTGCLTAQALVDMDDRHQFFSDRGPAVYLGQGLPAWVGPNLERFFTEEVDRTKGLLVSATLNRRRDQYIATVVELANDKVGQRISSEFEDTLTGAIAGARVPDSYRLSRYEDPRVTALGRFEPPDGGVERVLAGTEEGFVLWMDRKETQRVMSLDVDAAYGPSSFVVGTFVGGETSSIPFGAAAIDTVMDGIRGQPVRWGNTTENPTSEIRGHALFAAGGFLYLDRVPSALPATGDTVTVGAMSYLWETGWLELGQPTDSKLGRWLELITAIQSSGSLACDVFQDLDETTVVGTLTFDMTEAQPRNDLLAFRAKWFKFRFRSPLPSPVMDFELTHLLVRVDDAEQD